MALFNEDDLICYCYQYSKRQIVEDYLENKTSTILRKIKTVKKEGLCDCAKTHPKGH